MTVVYLALGSNLGDRLANLRAAVAGLEERGIAVTARSSVWETPPVPADQPSYLNAVVAAETALDPPSLLRELKAIEHALGRRPGPHWGPRPIDIDILFYGDERIETPELTVPHPRIAGRAFVLAPLADITRGALPCLGESALDLLEVTGLQGAVRRFAL
jgi:2-amino-4-hydroxy-6-hydroxymethyldihydropteridine diphosphokinase